MLKMRNRYKIDRLDSTAERETAAGGTPRRGGGRRRGWRGGGRCEASRDKKGEGHLSMASFRLAAQPMAAAEF